MALDFALPIPMVSRITNDLTNLAWFPVNAPDGLPRGVFQLILTLIADQDVKVSYDGVNQHDYIYQNTSRQISFQTNSTPTNHKCVLKQGTVVYIQGVGGAGNFYVSGWYQPSNSNDIL
jgi:hypothetical protein